MACKGLGGTGRGLGGGREGAGVSIGCASARRNIRAGREGQRGLATSTAARHKWGLLGCSSWDKASHTTARSALLQQNVTGTEAFQRGKQAGERKAENVGTAAAGLATMAGGWMML